MAPNPRPQAAGARQAAGASPDGASPATQGPTLLLAETDQALAADVTARLQKAGVTTQVCNDGAEALLHAGLTAAPVILLGVPLPAIAADTATRLLTAASPATVLIGVGPDIGEEATAALNAGAAAIVARPYRTRELLPFLGLHPTAPTRPPGSLVVGDIELDAAAHMVLVRGQPLRLPAREFLLLRCLMRHANRVVPHEELLREVWGQKETASNSLTVHIRRVRSRLSEGAGSCCTIDTVRGIGYQLVCLKAGVSLRL